jgi:Mg/Co/Ni transporter MgtE
MTRRRLPWVLLAVCLAVMAAGLLLGEYDKVLEKAVTVCLDCIGIG